MAMENVIEHIVVRGDTGEEIALDVREAQADDDHLLSRGYCATHSFQSGMH
jgi:hypothetical protein